jgi:YggT family protein
VFGGGYAAETPAGQIVILFATVLSFAIFIRAILSWFQMDPRSPLIQALDAITEPIIGPIRQVMPRLGMFDLSPLVAILLLNVGGQFLAQLMDAAFGGG